MNIAFDPKFQFTKSIKRYLARIEKAKQAFDRIPLHADADKHLLMRFFSLLEDPTPNKKILENYLNAHTLVKRWSRKKSALTEAMIQKLHAAILGKKSPSKYRKGQNGVLDGNTKEVLYLPPKASDVAVLMKSMVAWINSHSKLAPPVLAALTHFGINSIHPYYDGNGRLARLLTAFILMQRGYDLKGHLCLEEAYAQNLETYYEALALGPYHSYYKGPLKHDLSSWLAYFCKNMASSCEQALKRAKKCKIKQKIDNSPIKGG